MATINNSEDLDRNVTSVNESELTEKSSLLLPQGEIQNSIGSNQDTINVEESSFEFSGYSNVIPSGGEYSSEIGDPFNSVFYHIIPSENATHIHFYVEPIFKSILSVLEKEFHTPGAEINKFLLKTHVDGKRCHIYVDRTDLTVVATGPGHACWKERNFRKMTLNMFKKFVDHTNASLTTNTIDNAAPRASGEIDSSRLTDQGDSTLGHERIVMNNSTASDPSLQQNITSLMDKIHSLQGEMNKLRTEVNKLVIQASDKAMSTSENVASISPTDQNSTTGNVGNGHSVNVIDSTDHEDLITRGENLQQTYTVSSDIRLTSTPIVPRPTWSQAVETQQPRQSQYRPRPQTESQPKPTTKKILLMGDSIISGINKNGLKDKVYKHGISGATIDTLLQEIEVYDLQNFSHIILYIGGNNASNKTDCEYFEEKYDQLIYFIKERNKDCKIVLVNSCPRGDTDVSQINEAISGLADQHEIMLVDAYKAFFNKKRQLAENYYSWDKIHLSDSGVKRLVGTISHQLDIVDNYSRLVFNKRKQTMRGPTPHGQNRPTTQGWQSKGKKQPCSKCGESNHETKDCRHVAPLQCHKCGYFGHKSRRCQPN